jgi:hypothetical protein
MPFTAPGSLRPDDVYTLIAFILAENEIVDRAVLIDAHKLRTFRMPARDRCVAEKRTGTSVFADCRRAVITTTPNYKMRTVVWPLRRNRTSALRSHAEHVCRA